MAVRIDDLEDFGLDEKSLFKLGNRVVEVEVYLKPTENVKPLFDLKPEERVQKLCEARCRRQQRALRAWPTDKVGVIGPKHCPWGFRSSVSARTLRRAKKIPGLHSIRVTGVQGRRRRSITPPRRVQWYAVRGRVAVQVESEVKGLQTVEDRIVVVRATSEKEAQRKLASEWDDYEQPYLNHQGYMVRWHLEGITDVWELFDDEFNPKGTEVYSNLRSRRMKPKFEWHPVWKKPRW